MFNFLDFCPLCISFWTLEALRTRWKLMGLAKNCSWELQHPYIHEWILWLHLSVPHSHLEIRNNRRLQAWRKRVFFWEWTPTTKRRQELHSATDAIFIISITNIRFPGRRLSLRRKITSVPKMSLWGLKLRKKTWGTSQQFVYQKLLFALS